MSRTIIHLDLDAFFCAVEELRNPALHGRAFAVGGQPEERGVVSSCSYPARRLGVHSAMPMSQAQRLCPGLIIVPPDHRAYRAMSRQVMARLHALTPLVEQISIDEAFLDVSDLTEPGETLARRLQSTIRTELALPCSLGVAGSKLVAKIASSVGKTAACGSGPPNAILVVAPGTEAEFLAPLPSDVLWGVGPKTAERLAQFGMHTIGDIARRPVDELIAYFGKHGHELAQRSRGLDSRPVVTESEIKSVSQEITFSRDVDDGVQLRQTLAELASGVSRDLKNKRLLCATVKLKLRWPDFTTPTRQATLTQPTDDADLIYSLALRLFERLWQPGRRVRLLGVGVSGLSDGLRQLNLWDQPDEKSERLHSAVAALRSRFGDQAIQLARDLDEPQEP